MRRSSMRLALAFILAFFVLSELVGLWWAVPWEVDIIGAGAILLTLAAWWLKPWRKP